MSGRAVAHTSRDYEIAVADILSYLVGATAQVEHDVTLPGKRSGTQRQIDVLVRGRMFGLADAVMVVDCKRWRSKLDVADVGSFLDLLEDVGASSGLLVTTVGYSKAAVARAKEARGVSVEVMTLDELEAWDPPGSASVSFRTPADRSEEAEKALRRAGFRVRRDRGLESTAEHVIVEASRHYGNLGPDGEERRTHMGRASEALIQAGLTAEIAATGLTVGGGTPAHDWLEVTDLQGERVGIRILAASEEDVENELLDLAASFGVSRDGLSVERPPGWPFPRAFTPVDRG